MRRACLVPCPGVCDLRQPSRDALHLLTDFHYIPRARFVDREQVAGESVEDVRVRPDPTTHIGKLGSLMRSASHRKRPPRAHAGIARVRTDNDGENAPILHLNASMGYTRRKDMIQLMKAA